MSLRELWSPETVAPKIRNDFSRLAGKPSDPSKPRPRDLSRDQCRRILIIWEKKKA
jgi:hypothetical protein